MTHLLGERPLAHRAADVDRRFYAFVLDRLLGWGLVAVACWAAYELFWSDGHLWPGAILVASVVLVAWWGSAALLGLSGTSPGKALAGLRALDQQTGTPVGIGRALLRGLVLGVATIPTFGFGLATLAWTALADPSHRRRGWHDRLTGSMVVDVRRAPEADLDADTSLPEVVNLTAMRLVPAGAPHEPTTPSPPRGDRLPSRPAPTSPPPLWVLAFDTGQRVPVDGLVLVGRCPQGRPGESVRHVVPLPSGDLSLSKTHAQVGVSADGALVVMDRGSTNGSVLTRQGASRPLSGGRPATLLEGDVVRFGDRTMEVSRDG